MKLSWPSSDRRDLPRFKLVTVGQHRDKLAGPVAQENHRLMLPVSVTAVMIRVIFKLKLADIIITVTSGGPGGATDSVTSFIYREYRDRSNVGYGTLLALVYLVIIVFGMTMLMKIADRIVKRMTGRL